MRATGFPALSACARSEKTTQAPPGGARPGSWRRTLAGGRGPPGEALRVQRGGRVRGEEVVGVEGEDQVEQVVVGQLGAGLELERLFRDLPHGGLDAARHQ